MPAKMPATMPAMMSAVLRAAKGVLVGAVGLVVIAAKGFVTVKPSIVSVVEAIIALKDLVVAVTDLITAVKGLIAAIKSVWAPAQAGQPSWIQGWRIGATIDLESPLVVIQTPVQPNWKLLVRTGLAVRRISGSVVDWGIWYWGVEIIDISTIGLVISNILVVTKWDASSKQCTSSKQDTDINDIPTSIVYQPC